MRSSHLRHRPSRRRAMLAASLAALMMVVMIVAAAPSQALSSINASWCPKSRMFLARGSRVSELTVIGVLPEAYKSTDDTMQIFSTEFKKQTPGADAVWVAYQAVPVLPPNIVAYQTSIGNGVRSMFAAVHGFMQACPQSTWGMSGYSQGADLVGQFGKYIGTAPSLWHDTPTLMANLRVAVVLANPSRNSHMPTLERLLPLPMHDGAIARAYQAVGLGDQVADRLMTPKGGHVKITGSFCKVGDPVCDYTGWNFLTNLSSHGKYREVAIKAADWASDVALTA